MEWYHGVVMAIVTVGAAAAGWYAKYRKQTFDERQQASRTDFQLTQAERKQTKAEKKDSLDEFRELLERKSALIDEQGAQIRTLRAEINECQAEREVARVERAEMKVYFRMVLGILQERGVEIPPPPTGVGDSGHSRPPRGADPPPSLPEEAGR